MPRQRRRKSATELYHVIVKGINKEKIYNQNREKTYFKKIILKHLGKYQVEIYSYCIMSNHAHFIIRAELQVLSAFMAVILAEYALYYNFKHHRNGHVFQNRFISECIESERYYWNCLRYIHLNPRKANIVKDMSRYAYSSIGEYKVETPEIISKRAIEIYQVHFRNFLEFEEFHGERATEVFQDIVEEMKSQRVEVARTIAEEVFAKYDLALLNQVFEEKNQRKEYIQKLQKELDLTEKQAEKLCINVMKMVENE